MDASSILVMMFGFGLSANWCRSD